MPITDICIIQVTSSARIVINFLLNKLLLTFDKQGEIINNKHVEGTLKRVTSIEFRFTPTRTKEQF